MSRYDYEKSKEIAAENYPFYALIMAAIQQADIDNMDNMGRLRGAFPETCKELQERYNAPGGYLPKELKEAYG